MKSFADPENNTPLFLAWLVTLTVASFYMYEYFLRVLPSVMISYFVGTFGATIDQISQIETSYYWTYVPLQIFVGTILDIYGVRRPLFIALSSCIIGNTLFSFNHGLEWLILGRALIGFGSAFGFVAVLKTANLWLPKKHFPIAIGIATAMGSFGAIMGKAATAKMITSFGVTPSMDIITTVGIALTAITFMLVYDRETKFKTRPKNKKVKSFFKTLSTVLSNSQIWIIGFVGMLLYLPTQILGLWDISFLTSAYKIPPSQAAMIATSIYWGWIIGSPLVGYISEYIQNKINIIIFGSIGAAISLYLLIYHPVHNVNTLSVLLFLLGLFSSVEILVFDLAANICRRSQTGTAVAITNMLIMLGGYLQYLIAYVLKSSQSDIGSYSVQAFQSAFSILPLGVITALLLSLFIKQPDKRGKIDD